MLGRKNRPEEGPDFEVTTLTRDDVIDAMEFLEEAEKAVGGGQGASSLPVFIAVNGVKAPEGGRVFKRINDGTVGAFPPEKPKEG